MGELHVCESAERSRAGGEGDLGTISFASRFEEAKAGILGRTSSCTKKAAPFAGGGAQSPSPPIGGSGGEVWKWGQRWTRGVRANNRDLASSGSSVAGCSRRIRIDMESRTAGLPGPSSSRTGSFSRIRLSEFSANRENSLSDLCLGLLPVGNMPLS